MAAAFQNQYYISKEHEMKVCMAAELELTFILKSMHILVLFEEPNLPRPLYVQVTNGP